MTNRAQETLIPSSLAVRAELARNVREGNRLRSLLRVAVKAEEDRAYVAALAARFSGAEPRTETTNP